MRVNRLLEGVYATAGYDGWCCASQHSLQIHFDTREPSGARERVRRHACGELINVWSV